MNNKRKNYATALYTLLCGAFFDCYSWGLLQQDKQMPNNAFLHNCFSSLSRSFPLQVANLFDDSKGVASIKKYLNELKKSDAEKDKIFLGLFWEHLRQKNWKDRTRRLKYFPCGIDLIKNSKFIPVSKEDPNNPNDILHRFGGTTAANDIFYVQIKEDKKTDQKFLVSVFPESK